MKKTIISTFVIFCFITIHSQPSNKNSFIDKLSKLDPNSPGKSAQIFAPGKVSTPLSDWGITISTDGNEIFYTVNSDRQSTIVSIKYTNEEWSDPEVVSFSGEYKDFCPNINSDGTKIVFGSKRPTHPGDTLYDGNYWCVERKNDKWGNPYLLKTVSSKHNESFLFMHKSGDLYFCRRINKKGEKNHIYHSKYSNGTYSTPERIQGEIKSQNGEYCPFVFPDEKKMIVELVNEKDGFGNGDMYISYKQYDGSWGKPINLGEKINSEEHDCFPILTPDEKYLIFMSCRKPQFLQKKNKNSYNKILWNSIKDNNHAFDFYWIEASVLSEIIN